jgi:glyoxylase-like metal-dependent hydrolase (beta-lactamase superfamily II)
MNNNKFNRRQFIRLNTAFLGGSFLASVLGEKKLNHGEEIPANKPPGGFYRFTIGEMKITVFSDGFFHFPMELLAVELTPYDFIAFDADPDYRDAFFSNHLVPDDHVPLQMSPLLIETGDQRILVDSGWGEESPPTAGLLGTSLESLGISNESIDLVILTHAHPDHLGGLVNPATGNPVYPNAEVVMSETELAFWESDDPDSVYDPILDVEAVVPAMKSVLGSLRDHIRVVSSEQEITTGIQGLLSPGHTPGHMCVMAESGNQSLMIVGDSIVFTHVSFEYPEWRNFADIDHTAATESRRMLLDRASSDEMLIMGFHFPFPGLGYALRHGNAYRWHPAGWNVLR